MHIYMYIYIYIYICVYTRRCNQNITISILDPALRGPEQVHQDLVNPGAVFELGPIALAPILDELVLDCSAHLPWLSEATRRVSTATPHEALWCMRLYALKWVQKQMYIYIYANVYI